MKLEVGMFIRFKDKQGIEYIRKIKNIYLPEDISYRYGEIEIDKSNHNTNVVSRKNIIKASHNIIDLIEVGDYVNGYLIDYINLTCETPFLRSERPYRVDNTLYSTLKEKGRDYNQVLHFYNEDIETIVTREQFSAMEYRLGDK